MPGERDLPLAVLFRSQAVTAASGKRVVSPGSLTKGISQRETQTYRVFFCTLRSFDSFSAVSSLSMFHHPHIGNIWLADFYSLMVKQRKALEQPWNWGNQKFPKTVIFYGPTLLPSILCDQTKSIISKLFFSYN